MRQDEAWFDPTLVTFSFRAFRERALLLYLYDTCNNFLQVRAQPTLGRVPQGRPLPESRGRSNSVPKTLF